MSAVRIWRVTLDVPARSLRSVSRSTKISAQLRAERGRRRVSLVVLVSRAHEVSDVPHSLAIDIAGRLLLEEAPDLLYLRPSGLGVEKQVAQLARVRLDIDGAFRSTGIALQDEDLVLRPTSL